MISANVLVGITGSIACLSSPAYIQALSEKFSHIRVIMTESAQTFIPKQSIQLFCSNVHTKLFPNQPADMSHAQLAQWADLFIIVPATAHCMAQAAHGLAGSLLLATVLAHSLPILFFPNMNRAMWDNPATQRNRKILEEYGHRIILPVEREGLNHASGQKALDEYMSLPHEVIHILEREIHTRVRVGQKESHVSSPCHM